MTNTYQIIINWDKGQAFSERMAAKLMDIEGFEGIDPQCPMGGPDGSKDIICYKAGKKYTIGCYFPNGQKDFKEIREKFNNDVKGITKNDAQGFIFITNQRITPTERMALCQMYFHEILIYHGERVCNILDSPKGYGIRLEYLGIELSKAEQISFLSSHLDLKQNFEEIKEALKELKKAPVEFGAVETYLRNSLTTALPIAGVKFSSRLSVEDLLIIHRTIMQETQDSKYHIFLGFRNVEVWIGNANKSQADFIPVQPYNVPAHTIELLTWWRNEYMKVIYGTDEKKISTIATFHERFLNIHPFLDGNGRVARTLASIQFKDLLDRDVKLENIETHEYFQALQKARDGNGQWLNAIFTALIDN